MAGFQWNFTLLSTQSIFLSYWSLCGFPKLPYSTCWLLLFSFSGTHYLPNLYLFFIYFIILFNLYFQDSVQVSPFLRTRFQNVYIPNRQNRFSFQSVWFHRNLYLLAIPLTYSVTFGRYLISLNLSFLIYKIGTGLRSE